jgi:hypothetical protein
MIIESLDDCKRLKQILGLIQSSTLPPLKGIDAFAIHNTCELIFKSCLDFEQKESGKQNELQKEKEKNSEEVKEDLPVVVPKKKRKTTKRKGNK